MEKKIESRVGPSNVARDIKIQCYDGKEERWRNWSAKYMARAQILGYKKYLEGRLDVNTGNLSAYTEMNTYTYGDLILNTDGVAFSIVEMSKTEEFPEGDARKAWLQLKERFEAETYTTKVQLKREFAGCRPQRGQDPDMWLMELEYIRQRLDKMDCKMQEEDLIAHIVSNLGKEYDQLVNVLEGELEGITMNKLRERIRSYYGRVIKRRGAEVIAEDHALWHQANKESKGSHLHKFKGRCKKCGKYGHKATHCRPERIGKEH